MRKVEVADDFEYAVMIHEEWYGQCRTCRYLVGDRWNIVDDFRCGAPMAEVFALSGMDVGPDSSCDGWYTYHEEACIRMAMEYEARTGWRII